MKSQSGDAPALRVWIDIDNPPQVQYLAPFAETFAARGDQVFVTARDHGIAHELLVERRLEFQGIGTHPGASKVAKTAAVLRRSGTLVRRLRRWKPDVAVFATRSAALAAPLLRIPGFALVDYEFIDLRAFRLARSYVVHPALLEHALRERKFEPRRLISYEGIKEDITFSGVDLDSIDPFRFPELEHSTAVRVLVRPPDERSHYHRDASSHLTHALLTRLAGQDDIALILSPRYPEQAELVRGLDWRIPPLVLDHPIPFLRLLTGVDAVITGGGTMAREAAYLGVPSYSVFSGELGAVDDFLEAKGRLVVLRDAAALAELEITRKPRQAPLARNAQVVAEIVDAIARVLSRRPKH